MMNHKPKYDFMKNMKVSHRKINSMLSSHIVGDYQSVVKRHFDGTRRTLFYTNKETIIEAGEKIISVTDVDGYILTANSAFAKASGYTKEELLGAPHYMISHPDMPKAAFKSLWDSVLETGKWQGYVKNLRKDGGFYWVFASIFTLHRDGKVVGYTSSRTAADPTDIQKWSRKYKELLQDERMASSA